MVGRVENKIVIVTGAGSGIGQATAQLLAKEGAKIIATDINLPHAEETAHQIAAAGGKAIAIKHDTADEAAWRAVVDRTVKEYGVLDVVINNAGIGPTITLDQLTLEEWNRVIQVNLTGVFLGTREGIRAMAAKPRDVWGSIVNMSSILGLVGRVTSSAYSASKGGVRLFTKTAALEAAAKGWRVRVNSLHPGFIETPMVLGAAVGGSVEAKNALIALHPMGRLGRSDEIAAGMLFLASDESSFMTGSELVIDGGYTAQ